MSPPSSTLFPYTTLFRSCLHIEERVGVSGDTTQGAGDQPAAGEDAADRQGLLFDGIVTPVSEDLGYRGPTACAARSEEHTSELQSRGHLVCRLLSEKKNI